MTDWKCGSVADINNGTGVAMIRGIEWRNNTITSLILPNRDLKLIRFN